MCVLPANGNATPGGRLLLRGARLAQRAVRAAHDAAQEVVLCRDELFGHVQGGVDEGLTAGWAVTGCGKRLVDGVDELSHRLDRGPLAGLDGLEYFLG